MVDWNDPLKLYTLVHCVNLVRQQITRKYFYLLLNISKGMSTIKPANEPGFIIEQNDTTKELTFILQPGGNVRTPREVLDDNATKGAPPPKRQLNRGQIISEKDAREIAQYIEDNNIQEI